MARELIEVFFPMEDNVYHIVVEEAHPIKEAPQVLEKDPECLHVGYKSQNHLDAAIDRFDCRINYQIA